MGVPFLGFCVIVHFLVIEVTFGVEVETFQVRLVLLKLLPGNCFEAKSILLRVTLFEKAFVVGLLLSKYVKLSYYMCKLRSKANCFPLISLEAISYLFFIFSLKLFFVWS